MNIVDFAKKVLELELTSAQIEALQKLENGQWNLKFVWPFVQGKETIARVWEEYLQFKKLQHLCMETKEAVDFLEKALKAKEIVNELTGMAQTEETGKLLRRIWESLDELLSPVCPDCHVKARRFITSPAELYDPDMANYPGGSRRSWTGDWFCPSCRKNLGCGEAWWRQ